MPYRPPIKAEMYIYFKLEIYDDLRTGLSGTLKFGYFWGIL